jgi:hypothetical protein
MEVNSIYQYVDGTTLVAVPEGDFTMGASGEDNPQHLVKLSSYWIYRTEVTNAQYARCVASSKCAPPDSVANKHFTDPLWANDPVVGVTYDQASAYCKWVNASLPTEAQWEKAARGPDGNRFPWGDSAPNCDLLNYNYCVGQTTEVTARAPGKSYYGALDMAGNVFEWVRDYYEPNYYKDSPRNDPTGPAEGFKRVVRSSSFASGGDESASARRSSRPPGETSNDLGFRCVVNDPTYFAPFCQQNVLFGVGASGEPVVGNPPNPRCADLSISMGLACGPGSRPQTIVTFNGPGGAVINAPNCVQDSKSNIYTCYEPNQVSICVECPFSELGQAVCTGEHYQLDGGRCVWDGAAAMGTKCLDGDTFDSTNHCCIAGDVSTTTCPAGFYYLDKQKGCVPYAAQSTYCVEKTVALKTCQ